MTALTSRIWISGGSFRMGSERHYPEEAPHRQVTVDGFEIDVGPVTNREYGRFVAATGYATVAERAPDPAEFPDAPPENLVPGSMVFTPTPGPVDLRGASQWWRWVPGADWRHPVGPASLIAAPDDHPVVHVALEDVEAYCAWAGRELPTEAEWEFAARAGLDGTEFAWGDDDPQEVAPVANTWQGRFPWENVELDGWTRTSPVGWFAPNGYGLLDMIGNVWEWTADWYAARPVVSDSSASTASCCSPASTGPATNNPTGGTASGSVDQRQPEFPILRRVVKGGSHLCARSYCFRYRPAARQPQMIDTGMSHLGFRTISHRPQPD